MFEKNKKTVTIAGESFIANPSVGDGRLIPVLLLDCTNLPEFKHLLLIHQHVTYGDIISRWGYDFFNSRFAELELTFLKPVELKFSITFDLRTQPGIADSIVQARSVYLQTNEFGSHLANNIESPRVMIEIPPMTKLSNWDSILLKQITKKLKNDGISKKLVKDAALQHLQRIREFNRQRLTLPHK
ncbi:hypothetical protein ACX3YG_13800 [Pseudomonas wadenswilerensis]